MPACRVLWSDVFWCMVPCACVLVWCCSHQPGCGSLVEGTEALGKAFWGLCAFSQRAAWEVEGRCGLWCASSMCSCRLLYMLAAAALRGCQGTAVALLAAARLAHADHMQDSAASLSRPQQGSTDVGIHSPCCSAAASNWRVVALMCLAIKQIMWGSLACSIWRN